MLCVFECLTNSCLYVSAVDRLFRISLIFHFTLQILYINYDLCHCVFSTVRAMFADIAMCKFNSIRSII
jgi:hypothetical protein